MVGKPSVVLEEDEFKIRDESKSIHVQGLSDYQEYDAGNRTQLNYLLQVLIFFRSKP